MCNEGKCIIKTGLLSYKENGCCVLKKCRVFAKCKIKEPQWKLNNQGGFCGRCYRGIKSINLDNIQIINRCSRCYETKKLIKISYSYDFCLECLLLYTKISKTCPLCKVCIWKY